MKTHQKNTAGLQLRIMKAVEKEGECEAKDFKMDW